MAKERGWWEFKTSNKASEVDLEHIADLIKQGYTEGEIAGDEDYYLSDLPKKRGHIKKVT